MKQTILLLTALFCITAIVNAQIITENFDGTDWVTSNAQTGSTVTIGGNTNSKWVYKSGNVATYNPNGFTSTNFYAKSNPNYFLLVKHSDGYLISPFIPNGITSMTFWANGNGSSQNPVLYVATNSKASSLTSWYSVNATMSTNGTSTASIWSLSSEYTVNSHNTISQYTYTPNNTNGAYFMFQSNGGNIYIDDIVITSPAPLPVNFGAVTATKNNTGVEIKWNVSTEINTDKYSVERSNDGSQFNATTIVTATNAPQYSWIDVSAITNTVYYRIKAIDKTGSYQYSSIIKLNEANIKQEFTVSPNPITGNQFNIQLNSFSQGIYSLNLFNTSGQQLYTQTINYSGSSLSQTIQLPAFIKQGMYQIQIANKEMKQTRTIIIIQ